MKTVVSSYLSSPFIFLEGTLSYLQNARKFTVKEYTDIGCVKRIRMPDDSGEEDTASGDSVELPVKIRVTGGRVSIVSSRLLMFNRIAKVEMSRDV